MTNLVIFTADELYDLLHDKPVTMKNKDGTTTVFMSEDCYECIDESEENNERS